MFSLFFDFKQRYNVLISFESTITLCILVGALLVVGVESSSAYLKVDHHQTLLLVVLGDRFRVVFTITFFLSGILPSLDLLLSWDQRNEEEAKESCEQADHAQTLVVAKIICSDMDESII